MLQKLFDSGGIFIGGANGMDTTICSGGGGVGGVPGGPCCVEFDGTFITASLKGWIIPAIL